MPAQDLTARSRVTSLRFTFDEFWIRLLSALRADAVGDSRVRVFGEVILKRVPGTIGALYAAAVGAHGQKAGQRLHLGERPTEVLDQALAFFDEASTFERVADRPLDRRGSDPSLREIVVRTLL